MKNMLNQKAKAKLKEEILKSLTYKDIDISDEKLEEEAGKKYRGLVMDVPQRYRHISSNDVPIEMSELPEEKNGMYIWGGVGVGKTSAVYALKDRWATEGRKLRIANITELLHAIKSSFGTDDVLNIVEESRYYIAFDDLGVEKDTEWAAEQVYRLVNHIYENKRLFIFTSNYSLKKLAERYGDYGDRIASRIAEMAKVVELKGNDRRI